jgi:sec-independent protein translocase protein TatC
MQALKAMSSHEKWLIFLTECRRRALYIGIVWLCLLIIFYVMSNTFISLLLVPVTATLTANDAVIFQSVMGPVLLPITLASLLSFIFIIPFVMYQIGAFMFPALYLHERKKMIKWATMSLFFLSLGVLFGYYVILPSFYRLFMNAIPSGIHYYPDLTATVLFNVRTLWLFACCFQLPIICLFLNQMGLISAHSMRFYRPYAIVFFFFIGMVLTPPDVISQLLLAIPLCVLYEFSYWLMKR